MITFLWKILLENLTQTVFLRRTFLLKKLLKMLDHVIQLFSQNCRTIRSNSFQNNVNLYQLRKTREICAIIALVIAIVVQLRRIARIIKIFQILFV